MGKWSTGGKEKSKSDRGIVSGADRVKNEQKRRMKEFNPVAAARNKTKNEIKNKDQAIPTVQQVSKYMSRNKNKGLDY